MKELIMLKVLLVAEGKTKSDRTYAVESIKQSIKSIGMFGASSTGTYSCKVARITQRRPAFRPVVHWLERPCQPTTYKCACSNGVFDLHDAACGAILSLSSDKKKYSLNPAKVTCSHCLSSHNFGQPQDWRYRTC